MVRPFGREALKVKKGPSAEVRGSKLVVENAVPGKGGVDPGRRGSTSSGRPRAERRGGTPQHLGEAFAAAGAPQSPLKRLA